MQIIISASIYTEIIENIYIFIKEIWDKKILSKDWRIAYFSPIIKEGDQLVCSYYRGIALLDTRYKV